MGHNLVGRAEQTKIQIDRLYKIKEFVKEGPKKKSEIVQYVKTFSNVTGRSISRDLKLLTGIGDLIYDSDKNRYSWFENKRSFANEAEYNLALGHSLDIVECVEEGVGGIYAEPLGMIKNLAEDRSRPSRFIRHLETGYFDTWRLLQSYREKLELIPGWGSSDGVKIITRGEPAGFKVIRGIPGGIKFTGEKPGPLITEYHFKGDYSSEEKDLIVKDLENLEKTLLGEIYHILGKVKNRTPLLGSCDFCPTNSVKIKT